MQRSTDDLVLPVDLDAEKAVLGSVIHSPHEFGRMSGALGTDDFSLEAHRRIWRVMADIWGVGGNIDSITVAGKLNDAGLLDTVGGLTYLVGLDATMGEIFGGESYAKRVKDVSIRRRTILACQKLMIESQTSESADVLARGEKLLRDLSAETRRESRLMGAAEIINECGGLQQFISGTQARVDLPWATVNHILAGGFRDGELIVVGARTSVGKTAAATQIANWTSSRNVGTAVFSLEMQKRDMLMRFAICRSGVDGNTVRTGRMSSEERRAYQAALMEATDLPVWFDDASSCTVPAIHSAVREMMTRREVNLIIVDYLQLLESIGRHSNRVEAVGSISRGLKIMASEFNVPVLALAQLNRDAEDRSEPELRDLRESGSIEQDANTVMFLHRTDASAQHADVIPVRMLVKKQRNGPTGYVDLLYHKRLLQFHEAITESRYAA